jgi:hypothetical protein
MRVSRLPRTLWLGDSRRIHAPFSPDLITHTGVLICRDCVCVSVVHRWSDVPYAARFGRPVGASANSQSPRFAEQRACDARLVGYALYEWMTCVLAHYSILLFNKREGKPPLGGELARVAIRLVRGRQCAVDCSVGGALGRSAGSRRSLPPRLRRHGTPCDARARGERLPRRAYSMRVTGRLPRRGP